MMAPHQPGNSPFPIHSPLFHADNADRYQRQELIREYERETPCRLAVMIDEISEASITYFEDLIYDADPEADLHLMLVSPGGDGEAAVRLVKSMQSRCKELTVIVPTYAKSAATLIALGAHHIMMAPFSDLGPIDPQILTGRGYVAAKDIIRAFEYATEKVEEAPDAYPIHALMLREVSGILVWEARTALDSSDALLSAALRSNTDIDPASADELAGSLKSLLIDRQQSHDALFSADNAQAAGLPILKPDLRSTQWQILWRLWAKYFRLVTENGVVANTGIYENSRVSHINSRAEEVSEYGGQNPPAG